MKIGIVCYPTFGGSGVVATELGKALAKAGHQVHFITYCSLNDWIFFNENLYYHEVNIPAYPLFQYPPYESALSSEMVHVAAQCRSGPAARTLCDTTRIVRLPREANPGSTRAFTSR